MFDLPEGIQEPFFWTKPNVEVDTADGDLCIEIANYAYSTQPTPMKLDKWQEWIIRLALARNKETGKRLYRQFLVSVARQNGKSTLASAFVLYQLLTRGDANVVGIASNVQQANIIYSRVHNIINNNASLKKRFTKLTETRALGTESGALYKVLPSKGASLQGHTMSLVIPDEVHLMNSDVYNAVVIGAGQVPDSLVFSITTAGDENSSLLLDLYERLQNETEGFGGVIWQADEDARVDDIDQLRKANPALIEGRMSDAQILQEISMLPESEARRYRLNRFIAADNAWLPHNTWQMLPRIDEEKPIQPLLVLDRTPDWSAASFVMSWKDKDQIYTEVLASILKPDVKMLVDVASQIMGQTSCHSIWMDFYTLEEVGTGLKERGHTVERLVRRDAFQAPPIAYTKILEGKVSHGHNPLVAYQLGRCLTKTVQESYRLVRANASIDIDVALATVYSIYLAEISRDKPIQVF